MDPAAVDWIINAVLTTLRRGETVEAQALAFLFRVYQATDREDVREALEPALARAIERQASAASAHERAAWLMLFVDAATMSDDARIGRAAKECIDRLRGGWGPTTTAVDVSAVTVEACLAACRQLVDPATLAPDAIDELERIVAGAYVPGDGLASRIAASGPRGRLADHVRTASALLAAFDLTGRLPYSMLAEELMQWARRALWVDQASAFRASPADPERPFVLNCEAARVCVRLAVLHSLEGYRQAAVLPSGVDYGADAARILEVLSRTYRQQDVGSPLYGLALSEWLAIQG